MLPTRMFPWMAVVAAGAVAVLGQDTVSLAAAPPITSRSPAYSQGAPNVLIIGGSAAFGWAARHNIGYIVRGLHAWERRPLIIQNRAVPGATVNNPVIQSHYGDYLRQYAPRLVILAWGFLNDLRVGTPWPHILAVIRRETLEALADRAVVWIVTPPATRATYTIDRKTQPVLVAREIAAARALHNPNVYVMNVLSREEVWLARHHQTYVPYMADPWDPNTAGHRLAGRLLAGELKRALPRGTVSYRGYGYRLLSEDHFTDPPRLS